MLGGAGAPVGCWQETCFWSFVLLISGSSHYSADPIIRVCAGREGRFDKTPRGHVASSPKTQKQVFTWENSLGEFSSPPQVIKHRGRYWNPQRHQTSRKMCATQRVKRESPYLRRENSSRNSHSSPMSKPSRDTKKNYGIPDLPKHMWSRERFEIFNVDFEGRTHWANPSRATSFVSWA